MKTLVFIFVLFDQSKVFLQHSCKPNATRSGSAFTLSYTLQNIFSKLIKRELNVFYLVKCLHSVARRVAAGGTIVPLGGATAGHRLSGVVPNRVGSLSLAVEPGRLLAAGHRIVPRGGHHALLLAGRVVRRSLLHVTLHERTKEF